MKIYVVAFDDLVNYGTGCCNVWCFTDKETAREFLKDRFVTKCEQCGIKNPFDTKEGEYGIDYAYIDDRYYWDIFERTINV